MQNDSHYDPIAIRRSLHAGNVYLTFGGDHEKPFMFAKVINVDGENLWLRLFVNNRSDRPTFTSTATLGESRIIPVSIEMFLAWGPPKFPIFVGIEAVSNDELSQLK